MAVACPQIVQKKTKKMAPKKKKELWGNCGKCQQLEKLNEEDLEFFMLYFQTFCWFKLIKEQIITNKLYLCISFIPWKPMKKLQDDDGVKELQKCSNGINGYMKD